MDSLTKALSLYEIGCHVFPARLTKDGSKVPAISREEGGNGHLDASDDPEQIAEWFQGRFKDALVGVHAGRSGLVLLDRDIKRDEEGNVTKDGFASLEDNWEIAPETFNYTSIRGEGRHDIYLAPENVRLNGQSDYRGWKGVDRRGGSSWWVWAGDTVPDSRDAFAPAPQWLIDPAEDRTGAEFLGDLDEWLDGLLPGEPNLLVKRAMARLHDDMSHSEMVSAQHNAVRLGAEGNPGVRELLEAIRVLWMNRPEENHGTAKGEWAWKFDDALATGIAKYGEWVDKYKNLPKYSPNMVPDGFPKGLLIGEPGDRFHYNQVLNEIAKFELDDDTAATILWNAPTTLDLSREWGIEFVYQRIEKSRITPEPIRENPALEIQEAVKDTPAGTFELLTAAERERVKKCPSWVDTYMAATEAAGIDGAIYSRVSAWDAASMAFAFRGFIKQGRDTTMGTNLWTITMGPSGSGKTTDFNFFEGLMDLIFEGDNEDKAPYHSGADTSPQGLHAHLLERDRKPTVLLQDEASVFFEAVNSKSWMSELTRSTADWYNGKVRSSSKLALKELRGKTALTSFHMKMMGTPDDVMEQLTDRMFTTGFLARVNWAIAPDLTPEQEDQQYVKRHYDGEDESGLGEASEAVKALAVDLMSAARMMGGAPKPIKEPQEVLKRMEVAHRKMGKAIKNHPKEEILKPALVRLGNDTMRKCAAICAMYRGDTTVSMDDTLKAIEAVEFWFTHLMEVVNRVAQGEFQNLCNDIEFFIRKQGRVSETKVLDSFRNRIRKDPRELDTAVNFLVNSGRVNREPVAGRPPAYTINGS